MKLSDTQLVILSAACQRDNLRVLPLPDRLKGNAAAKVVESLIAKGLVAEVDATREDPVWRESGDGGRITLVATGAALQALGIEPDMAPPGGTGREDGLPVDSGTAATDGAPAAPAAAAESDRDDGHPGDAPAGPTPKPARKTRDNSKQAQLIAMLKRPEGATIAQIAAAFHWQNHTARGVIAGALKKKLGLAVTSEKVEGRGRVYALRGEG